jgi:hypothetical protein
MTPPRNATAAEPAPLRGTSVRLAPEDLALWDTLARRRSLSRTDWLRAVLGVAAEVEGLRSPGPLVRALAAALGGAEPRSPLN